MSGLEAVLAAHEADVTSYDAGDIFGCRCGWEVSRADYDFERMWRDYRAHVAAAIREHLLSEAVVERAAFATLGEHAEFYRDEDGTPWHNAIFYTRAALTAATEEDHQ